MRQCDNFSRYRSREYAYARARMCVCVCVCIWEWASEWARVWANARVSEYVWICEYVCPSTCPYIRLYERVCPSYAASESLFLSLSRAQPYFSLSEMIVFRVYLARFSLVRSLSSLLLEISYSRIVRGRSRVCVYGARDTLEYVSRSGAGRNSFEFTWKAYEQRNSRKLCSKSIRRQRTGSCVYDFSSV